MEVTEAILSRRSVREYDQREVSGHQVGLLLEAALRAPSAGDVHPYEVVVVLEKNKRTELARACLDQEFVHEAPVDLVFLIDQSAAYAAYGRRGVQLYSLLDVGAAVENLMVAAAGMGLGTCWIGAFDEEEVGRTIGAPKGHRPVTVITLGYPRTHERGRAPPRVKDKTYLNSYGLQW